MDTFLNLSLWERYDVNKASRQIVFPVPVGISNIACPVESNVFLRLYMYVIC